jgi:hypothetical protein
MNRIPVNPNLLRRGRERAGLTKLISCALCAKDAEAFLKERGL